MRKTINSIKKLKTEGKKITALTAYDYSTAKIIEEVGIDIILVGDSLAMVALGHKTTHPVTVDEMIYHTKAVTRGAEKSLIVVDMPFMSYQHDLKDALVNAGRFIKEGGAQAIKLEGGSDYIISLVQRCTESGIPVMAHLGFTPQLLYTIGGYNIQGKRAELVNKITEQAVALEEAGAFALVLEMMPEESAQIITDKIRIPTLGIGGGRNCSGQILVTDDIIGKYGDFTPKFARRYADVGTITKEAVTNYKADVLEGRFPSEEEVFHLEGEDKEYFEQKKKFDQWSA